MEILNVSKTSWTEIVSGGSKGLWAIVVAKGERGPQHSTGYPMWIDIIFTSKQEAI
jgi:hypothetical protein